MSWAARRDALAAWISGATGLAGVWAGQDYAEPARPYWSLNIIAGPMAVDNADDENRDRYELAASDITVTPVVQNLASYQVTINGTSFGIISGGAATAAAIVAALVAAINAGAEPVTATDNLDGTLELVEDAADAFTLALTSNLSYANNDQGHELAVDGCGMRAFTVSCSVVTEDNIPPDDAISKLELAYNALALPAARAILDAAGLAINERLPMRRIPEKSGAQWVDRCTFDLRLSYAETTTERNGYITTVEVTPDFGDVDPDLET